MIRTDIDFYGDAKRVASQFGTPSFILYEQILKENYRRFSSAFEKHYGKSKVSYSIKTNYLPAVLETLHLMGSQMEAVSRFELYLALQLGIPPDHIIYNGPAKSKEDIAYAIEQNIFMINADSVSELHKIHEAARACKKRLRVGLRINIDTLTWKKFGIPLSDAESVFVLAQSMDYIHICGIHIHIGSTMIGNLHPKPYLWTLDHALSLIERISKRGILIEYLDMGGGFPAEGVGIWPKRDRVLKAISNRIKKTRLRKFADIFEEGIHNRAIFPKPTPVEEFARLIGNQIKERLHGMNLPLPTLILEPGRSIVNSAMTLIVTAIDIKSGPDHKMVIADGGINLAPPTEHSAFHVANISSKQKERESITLAGPLCMESDILCKQAMVSPVKENDILEIFNVGAYSICRSTPFIRPRAQAVMVSEDGTIEEIRKRESFDDVISLDRKKKDVPAT